MALTRELYDQYIRNDFKIILSTGYSPRNKETEEDKRYKAAKRPIEKDWNNKPTKSFEECNQWINEGGWISVVLPIDVMAVDVDASTCVVKADGKVKTIYNDAAFATKMDQIKLLLNGIKCGIHQSNNGQHLLFRMSGDYKSASQIYTKAGLNVTYRCGGLSNIIVAPSHGRKWLKFVDVEQLDPLPPFFQPIVKEDPEEVKYAVAMQLRYFYQNKILHGDKHIDMPFMAMLSKNMGWTFEMVESMFKMIYGDEYNASITRANYDRTKTEEKVVGLKTFFDTCVEKQLFDLVALVNLMARGKTGLTLLGKTKENVTERLNDYAESYARKNSVICDKGGLFYKKDGFYSPIQEENLRQTFAKYLGKNYKPRSVNDMVAYVKDNFVTEYQQDRNHLLLADNKVLSLTTLKTRDLLPSDIFFFKLPVKFDPNAKCERWEHFLVEVFPDFTEAIPFIQQFIGHIFLPNARPEICLMLRGEGANGKSVFMDTISYLVGSDNRSAISMSQMKNEYMLAKLQNKLLNVSTETESKGLIEDATLKSIISGEEFTCNIKFKEPIKFSPYCKFIFSSNNPLSTTDRSFGFERRVIFLPFNVDFKKNGMEDPKLRQKLEAEADGIFAWAMRGAEEYMKHDKFKVPDKLADHSQNEHKQGNPVWEFANSYLTWSSEYEAIVMKDLLYAEYKKFCKMNGYMVQNRNNFGRQLKRVIVGNAEQFERRKCTKNVYGNMKLRLVPSDNQGNYIEDLDGGDLAGKSVTECSYEEYLEFGRMKV